MGLPDPQRSRAVLIGTSKYEDEKLPNLPPVSKNIEDLISILTDSLKVLPRGHCITIENEGDIRKIGPQLWAAAEAAEDLLLVYYSGHGLIGGRKRYLHLALHTSNWDHPEFSSFEYHKLHDAVLNSRANTKVIILDCCFSGRATAEPMTDAAAELAAQVEVEGTYVLTSSLHDQVALYLPGEEHTAFTGRLLRILREGVPGGPEFLTIDYLFNQLVANMRIENLPRPSKLVNGNAERLAIAKNRAWVATTSESDQASVPDAAVLLDFEMIVHSLRALIRREGLSGWSDLGSPELASLRLHRARRLRDALSGESGTSAADTQDALRPGNTSDESLQRWGYRDRAALIMQALRPGYAIRRAQQRRFITEWREACVDLFRAARELRALVANNFDYRGIDIFLKVREIRSRGGVIQISALALTLLESRYLIELADRLAAAATRLVTETVDTTNLELGAMTRPPDFRELDACSAEFSRNAISQAHNDRPERDAAARESCLELFSSITELRAQMTSNYGYHGDEMAERVAGLRNCTASAQVHAFNLALLAPDLAEEATALATAATRLADAAEHNTDLSLGISIRPPEFTELDESSERLRRRWPPDARP